MSSGPAWQLIATQTTEFAILHLERDGTIRWYNSAAARLTGFNADALIGQPFDVLFTPEDRQRAIPRYELEASARGNDVHDDRWMQRADGSRYWASGVTIALRDDAGNLVGYGKVFRDTTDVRTSVDALRERLRASLNADEHKNVFLATLSHELRNPLAPLANAVHLIRAVAPNNPALAYPVKIIERQLEFIRRLVDDLLDVTRISTGKIELKLQPLDLRDVLEEAIETTRPLMDQRSHAFTQTVLAAPILVQGDRDRLQQVFVNLLGNAAKYTPEGGRIELRASSSASEAVVRVIDNGIGIDPSMQKSIFELFTQVAPADVRGEHGLGIGLSLVKTLVEMHNGTLSARSEGLGTGSEFSVRLPLANGSADC